MKLSISNIGWQAQDDLKVYELMKAHGFAGLEIAPTRIFPDNPYEDLKEAQEWSLKIKADQGFNISSMQSIWYGRSEKVFGSEEERNALIDYTKKAIDFAEAIGCPNLVFGCPRNRSIPDDAKIEDSVPFYKTLGDYASTHGCIVAMEANPPIYNTNFINTTKQALDLIKMVDSEGFLLNLDVGTMVENKEGVSVLEGYEKYIHHVHISEPGLKPVEKRSLHNELAALLKAARYDGFVSIEVGKQDDVMALDSMMDHVEAVFGWEKN